MLLRAVFHHNAAGFHPFESASRVRSGYGHREQADDPEDALHAVRQEHPGYGEGGKYHVKAEENPLPKGTVQRETVSNMEIWCECFRNTRESMRNMDSYAIKSIMSRIEGWERGDQVVKSKLYGQQRVYKRV